MGGCPPARGCLSAGRQVSTCHGGCLPATGCLPRGCLPRGCLPAGGLSACQGGVCLPGECTPSGTDRHLWEQNFSATTVADGNKLRC